MKVRVIHGADAVGDDNPFPSVSNKKKLATATLSNVAGSASNQTLLAANADREEAIIYNDSTANLRIKLGAAASSTSFTVLVGPNQTFVLSDYSAIYTGVIDGIWGSATGNARVTELTV